MHIINLNVKCKVATGDGTKIVCLNSDYVVRITAEDCGTFSQSPVKKLIIRHGKECYESDIKQVVESGKTLLQADLPPIDWADYVELGICGKEDDSPDTIPTYASTSARYECEKSILNGIAVVKSDPKLSTLKVSTNGTYRAMDSGSDGFYEVEVNVPQPIEESRVVNLRLTEGNQIILPSYSSYLMSKLTIVKPVGLLPENIRSGIDIGGVVGTYLVLDYDGAVTVIDEDEVALAL